MNVDVEIIIRDDGDRIQNAVIAALLLDYRINK